MVSPVAAKSSGASDCSSSIKSSSLSMSSSSVSSASLSPASRSAFFDLAMSLQGAYQSVPGLQNEGAPADPPLRPERPYLQPLQPSWPFTGASFQQTPSQPFLSEVFQLP